MANKKRKFNDTDVDSNISSIHFDPHSIPLICYEHIFQYLPIESLISVSLTCKTWYNILNTNRLCFNKNTKLTLLNINQLIKISNSKILCHINKIVIGKYECGLIIDPSIHFQFQFTSLSFLKLCFLSLTSSFITNLFNCISSTLQILILAIQPHKISDINPTRSCLDLLSSLYLLRNLKHFSILVKSTMKIEFDIEKYFKSLTNLEKLIIRQDNYTYKKSRIQQLTSIQQSLTNLKYIQWFDILPNDLKILSSTSCRSHLQHIHLEETLITNEILYYLSKIPTINSLKSHRFSPRKDKFNIHGFNCLLLLKETLQELEISTKRIQYDELLIIQNPLESDCTEDEYELYLTFEHINILKQFIHLNNLSFNKIKIEIEDLNNLLIHLAQYNRLKILNFESICFPSFEILSTIYSLEELSLAYPLNKNRDEYNDKNLLELSSLRNLKVLILYYSINLSNKIRKKLKEQTLNKLSSVNNSNLIFKQLEEFIYNNDQDEDDD